jgi:DNA recombination protein RmuC
MNFDLSLPFATFIIGAVLTLLWARSKFASLESIAEARGLSASNLELATLKERLNNAQTDTTRVLAEKSALVAELDMERVALDNIQQECTTNKVRAEQAAQLEQHNTALLARIEQITEESSKQRESIAQLTEQVASLTDLRNELRLEVSGAQSERDTALKELSSKSSDLAELNARYEAECNQSAEKVQILVDAKAQLTEQFQNLANQILEDKSQKFTQKNQENLDALLGPLHIRIKEFQQQVANTYDVDSKERLTLKTEIERLALLNAQVSTDAHNLTNALKGSVKTQGNWGEMLLEQVLELSGLRKGEQYFAQETYVAEDGRQQRPDVVVHVPGGRHLIVDSKVSLVAYERYCNAPDDATRDLALKEHLTSLRNHVKSLADKKYQGLTQLQAPDFVMLFIPLESAFLLAIHQDPALFQEAYTRNVCFVSPSTLQINLRTVANIWRIEDQNRNAKQIAEQCAKLYDKFVGFVEDLELVGKRIGLTQVAYDDAHKKLVTGRGNLVKQALDFKRLGVPATKGFPSSVEAAALAADEVVFESIAQIDPMTSSEVAATVTP